MDLDKLLKERVAETVRNLGKHIDRTYTQPAQHHQHFQGTIWDCEEVPQYCKFEEQAVRDGAH